MFNRIQKVHTALYTLARLSVIGIIVLQSFVIGNHPAAAARVREESPAHSNRRADDTAMPRSTGNGTINRMQMGRSLVQMGDTPKTPKPLDKK